MRDRVSGHPGQDSRMRDRVELFGSDFVGEAAEPAGVLLSGQSRGSLDVAVDHVHRWLGGERLDLQAAA